MKIIVRLLLPIGLGASLAACSATPVAPPAPKPAPPVQTQSRITERPLQTPRPESGNATVKNVPEPIPMAIVEDQQPRTQPLRLLSIDYVNDRIFEYGRKLERWRELDDQSVVMNLTEEQTQAMVRCFRDLQKVLNGYGRLHDELLQRNVVDEAAGFSVDDVIELQKLDVAFMDSVCGRMLAASEDQAAGWQERQEDADLNQIETLIERYSSNQEYDEVVQVWLKIPTYQVERVDLKTRMLYGNALMFLDQQEKAAEVYQQIVDEMSVSDEQPTDLLSLRKVLADLYTASGNYLAAEQQYEQISKDYLAIGRIEEWAKLQLSILDRSSKGSPELTEYSRLLREYLSFLPNRDGYQVVWEADTFLQSYPYSPVTSNVDLIRADALARADAWFNDYFTRVDQLAEEKKFQDAMELLQTIPEAIVGPENQEKIKAKTDELVLAEAVERETLKIERMQELQRRWNEGIALAEQNDFDGAIAIFTELLDSEYSDKAADKIEELSLQAAKADRRRAAELFIRFTKTEDLESRKRLLIETRRILKDILVKYPEVEIAQRVLGNIDRVEKEMNALDPMLLPAVLQQEREQQQAARQSEQRSEPPSGLDAFDLPASPTPAEPQDSAPGQGQGTPPGPGMNSPEPSSPPGSTSLPVLSPGQFQ